jgi:hypothetical protein
MANTTGTTQDLRETLFKTIQDLRTGKIEARTAGAVANLADKIIKTGDLDIRYTQLCVDLDNSDTGISAGPMMLGIDRSQERSE